jgi:phosphatidate cytidylyltransferase
MDAELKKRVTTGVIGGAALLVLIIWGSWPGIFVLTMVLSLGMLNEYALMVYSMNDQIEKRYALLCLGWFVGLMSLIAPRAEIETLLISFMGLFTYFLFRALPHQDQEMGLRDHFKELAFSIFGLIYLSLIPFYLPRIHQSANGIQWTIVFLLIVFSNDTGAYFAGKKYGKTKLYPLISPKKTKEGALGGLALGYIIAILSKATFFRDMPWVALVLAPGLVGVVSQVGDFCESFVKRAFDKKDSGSILPGHGGFLDRFDGVVFSLPVMYACVRLFS